MNASKEVSRDIVKYLQEKKGLSIDNIAKAMGTSFTHIQEIIDKKSNLKSENIEAYLNNNNIRFWEFALEIFSMEKLPLKVKNKILLCQQLSKNLKKNKI